jgi:hypothetical protein
MKMRELVCVGYSREKVLGVLGELFGHDLSEGDDSEQLVLEYENQRVLQVRVLIMGNDIKPAALYLTAKNGNQKTALFVLPDDGL